MRHHTKNILVLGFAFLAAACTVKAIGDPEKPITIKAHIVIDVRELKSTATNIEDMVEAKASAQPATSIENAVAAKAEPAIGTASKPTRLSFLSLARRWMEPSLAYAEGGYDLKEITPEVRAALDGRANRFNKLSQLKATGKVGEDNEGHVKNLSGDASLGSMVQAENRDREIIYNAIVKQNMLPSNSIFTVRSVFAEVQNKKAKPGEKVQLPNGEWITKS